MDELHRLVDLAERSTKLCTSVRLQLSCWELAALAAADNNDEAAFQRCSAMVELLSKQFYYPPRPVRPR